MKRILSALLITAMLFASMLAIIPAYASDEVIYKYEIDYTALDYKAYKAKSYPLDNATGTVTNASAMEEYEGYLDLVEPVVEKNSLSLKVLEDLSPGFYVATEGIKITPETKYSYYIEAKNNKTGAYTGVPYAVSPDGPIYHFYGALNNGGDDDKSKNVLRTCVGTFDCELFGSRWEAKIAQDLTPDGYGQYKLVFDGLELEIFTLSGGEWVLAQFSKDGNSRSTMTLPEGSEIAVGVYNRNSSPGTPRVPTITNSKIVAENEAAAAFLAPVNYEHMLNKALILDPNNYSEDTYAVLDQAITDALNVPEGSAPAVYQASADMLEIAMDGLKYAFKVNFDANGATGTMPALENIAGEVVLPAEPAFTAPEGKHFVGWALSADGEPVEDHKINVSGTMTVYAVWEITTYVVEFNENGGSGKMFSVYDIVGEYTLPECKYTAPAGKEFKGWALSADGEPIADATVMISSDVVLYAIWGLPTFTVTFDANGGSGEMASVEAAGEYTLPACAFAAPEGKQFKGWSLTADGETVEKINVTGAVTLYAVWEDIPAAPTEQPTAAPTDAPAATEAPKTSGGCGGSIAATAVAVAVAALGAVVLKKKEN